MDQSEMMMIPNTPTLVAEENVHYKSYQQQQLNSTTVKNHPAAAHESMAMEQVAPAQQQPIAVQPAMFPRHRGPAVKDKTADQQQQQQAKDRLPDVGEYFDNDKGDRFVFRAKLGDGAMGHVFLSTHQGRTVAIKTEKFSTGMLPMEIKVLMTVKRSKGSHFCDIIDYGTMRREYNYMVISILGKDLYRLRAEMPQRSFSLNTTTKIALETLEAIEELHNVGYLSRDVKPSNFAPGVREHGAHKKIFMFDFGLAKKFVDRENRKIKSRGEVGWRGTVRYGSLVAHKRMDLGRRDDVECWFYMLYEMYVGELPWRHITDRAAVGQAKANIREKGREAFFRKVPRQFETIMGMVDGYAFEQRPEYKHLKALIHEIRSEHSIPDRCTWDWQAEESEHSELTETASVMSDLAILAEQGATNYTDRGLC